MSCDFSRLISPFPKEAFFRDYWERQPFKLLRGDPGFYRDLLGGTDLESLVEAARPQVTENGATFVRLEPHGGRPLSLEEARQAYVSGRTLIFQNLQKSFPEVAILCRSLEIERKCQVLANLFFTPPQSQGFGIHFDARDVFAVQLAGRKTWRLFENGPELPLADHPLVELPIGVRLEPSDEVVLSAGDVLYVPRGHFHEVVASDLPSVHISVTLIPTRWVTLLTEALAQVARRDVRFRRGVDPALLGEGAVSGGLEEAFRELVAALGESIDVGEAARSLARRYAPAHGAVPEGRLHG